MVKDQKSNADEIDLVHMLNRLMSFSINALKTYFRIILKNITLFISIIAVIAIAGYSLRFILPRYYRTQAVYVAHYLPTNMYASLLGQISELASSGKSNSVIAQTLKITEENASAIHAIETVALNPADYQFRNDTTPANVFRVILELKQLSGLKEIQVGLKEYLENNEYALKRKSAKRKLLEMVKYDLMQKKRSLDSLQASMNKPEISRGSGQVIVMAQPLMPVEAYKILQDNSTRLLQVEQELEMAESVEIVEPFLNLNAPNAPDTNRLFKLSIILALLASMLLTPLFGRK